MEEKTKAYQEQIRSLEETIEQETKEKNEIQRKLDKLLKGNKNTAEYVEKVMNEIRGLKYEKEELSLTVEEKTRENDLLRKKTNADSIEIGQLKEELNEKRTKCKVLEEEVTKYRSFSGRKYHHYKLFLRLPYTFRGVSRARNVARPAQTGVT